MTTDDQAAAHRAHLERLCADSGPLTAAIWFRMRCASWKPRGRGSIRASWRHWSTTNLPVLARWERGYLEAENGTVTGRDAELGGRWVPRIRS
ncbi:hypothetical protein [Arthrobacter sp. NA-172]|uniref:hypothetical protein n=1 Tax=Arthrobacter sp. NA-172 TaxID=3367524 RepID=UPI0037543600